MSKPAASEVLHGPELKEAILARVPALAQRIGKGAAARERARKLPFSSFKLIREAGIGTLRIPASLGGPGGTVEDVIETVASLSAADSNVGHALRAHFNFTETLFLNEDSLQLRQHVRNILAGRLYGSASTEIGTSRPGEITTRLSGTANGLRLDGRKYYATGTAYADFVSTNALDDDGNAVRIVIPTTREGVTVLDDWDGMGQRLTASGGIEFKAVKIEPGEFAVSGKAGLPGRHASTFRQLFLAACIAGIVRNVLADALVYVRGQARPITHSHAPNARGDLFVQGAVGRISAASQAIDVLVADAARRLDRGYLAVRNGAADADSILNENALAIARMQAITGPLALHAAQAIFDTGGASATSSARNFDRHWRNIRTILSHNPLSYKEKVVGAFLLDDEPVPLDGGFF